MNVRIQPVLGLPFHVGHMTSVMRQIEHLIQNPASRIILPCSLNDIVSVTADEKMRRAYADIDILLPDGMPIVWWLRHKAAGPVERLYGPAFMKHVLQMKQPSDARHVVFGSSRDTLQKLSSELKHVAPHARVVAYIPPPFGSWTQEETHALLEQVKRHKPTVLWIGLPSPRQVLLASEWKRSLPNTTICCVGAAFDLLAGARPMAPRWIQTVGLEWAFRLLVEPRRLWKRYLVDIPVGLVRLGIQTRKG